MKKIIKYLLTSMLMVSVFSGCGNNSSSNSASSSYQEPDMNRTYTKLE